MADDRKRQLDVAISQIEKEYGKGAIMRLGDKDALVPVAVIPTGALSLDVALGMGGLPRGRPAWFRGCRTSPRSFPATG